MDLVRLENLVFAAAATGDESPLDGLNKVERNLRDLPNEVAAAIDSLAKRAGGGGSNDSDDPYKPWF